MFEFGTFSEILIILVAAIILIGPKELPRILYQWGRWLQKIRHLSQKLRQGLDNYVEEGALDEYVETRHKQHIKGEEMAKSQTKSLKKRTPKKRKS